MTGASGLVGGVGALDLLGAVERPERSPDPAATCSAAGFAPLMERARAEARSDDEEALSVDDERPRSDEDERAEGGRLSGLDAALALIALTIDRAPGESVDASSGAVPSATQPEEPRPIVAASPAAPASDVDDVAGAPREASGAPGKPAEADGAFAEHTGQARLPRVSAGGGAVILTEAAMETATTTSAAEAGSDAGLGGWEGTGAGEVPVHAASAASERAFGGASQAGSRAGREEPSEGEATAGRGARPGAGSRPRPDGAGASVEPRARALADAPVAPAGAAPVDAPVAPAGRPPVDAPVARARSGDGSARHAATGEAASGPRAEAEARLCDTMDVRLLPPATEPALAAMDAASGFAWSVTEPAPVIAMTPDRADAPRASAPVAGSSGAEAVRAAEGVAHQRVLSGEARGQIVLEELGRIEVRARAHGARLEVRVGADEGHAARVLADHAAELRAHVRIEAPGATVHVDASAPDPAGASGSGGASSRSSGGEHEARRGAERREGTPQPRPEPRPSAGRHAKVRFVL